MNAGILVHTQSGHTGQFAQCIGHRLKEADIEYNYEILRSLQSIRPRQKRVSLREIPEVDDYDVVLIGGPVWGFTLSPVIRSVLHDLEGMKGKKALPFVTYGAPFPAFGARQALATMSEKLESLGAQVLKGEALLWFLFEPTKKMEEAADRIVSRIKG